MTRRGPDCMDRLNRANACPPDEQSLRNTHAHIARIVASLTLHASNRDDLVQEVWLALLSHPPRRQEQLGSWVRVVARRTLARMRLRDRDRARRERRVATAEALRSTIDALVCADVREHARRQVAGLHEPYRTVITLHYLGGASIREVARAAHASPATVRSQLARGISHLRERLSVDRADNH